MLSSERQYVAVLKGVQETYLSMLELSDTPESIRGKADSLFPCWADLTAFHSQELLPAMEDALVQSLLQQDCFSKFVSEKSPMATFHLIERVVLFSCHSGTTFCIILITFVPNRNWIHLWSRKLPTSLK